MDPNQNNEPNPTPVPPAQPEPQSPPPAPQAIRYIAVDANGVPLPNQPADMQPVAASDANQPQLVYMSRPLDPIAPQMSDETKRRHEESKKKYSFLNLSEGEYVISHIKRHPIGLISIWLVAGIIVMVLLGILLAFGVFGDSLAQAFGVDSTRLPSLGVLSIPIMLLTVLVLIGGYIASLVYGGNQFFLTNESVIQEIQTSLFAKREQTVSLGNIEDASYTQNGVIAMMFGYGAIRLSTQGDETTYRFNFVANPKEQIAQLNDSVEAFKNGRPVSHH